MGKASAQANCAASAPVINGTVTDVSCNGANNGSIDITPAGGRPPFTYSWSNGATTQDISGLAPGTYSVTVRNGVCETFGVELVSNSGFESGNTGFSSSYSYCNSSGCLVPEGRYAIGNNAGNFHGNFEGTPRAGNNFLVVNGIGSPNTSVWCQTITVQPNTVYNFSTWVASVNVTSPALLQFSINGVTIGNVFQAPATLNTWSQFFAVWSSGANTTANICIVNQNTTASGNDFGLDDISFMECVNCSATRTFTVAQPAPLTLTVATNTPVSCNGANNGSVVVTPAGGTAPYTVTWSNGQTGTTASNLAPGNYTATVRDARGCTANVSATISQPLVLTAVAATTNLHNGQALSCNGATDGSATVTPAGGTAPYTYQWSNGATTQTATGLGAGTYTATVRDVNGCTVNASVTLTAPPVLSTTTAVAGIVTCNGASNGSVSVNPTGGTAPYSYLWNTGATTQTLAGVGAGSYSVRVTDVNGCFSDNTVTLNQPPVLATTATVTSDYNGQPIRCNGSSGAGGANLAATPTGGTAPYTYVWSNGATTQNVTGVAAGTYTVTVRDANGCTANASVTVTEPPVLTSNANVTSNYNGQAIRCNGGTDGEISVTPGGGTAPYTYQWSNGATTQTVTGVGAGTYTVTITDANGCTANSSVTVAQPAQAVSGTAQVTSNYNGRHISCNGASDGSISVTPAGGTAPYTYQWNTGATTQSVSGLPAGTYTVTIRDANGCTANASVTVNQPPVLTTTAAVTSDYNGQPIRCNGTSGATPDGILTAMLNGGTAPYTYAWSNGAGTQTVTGVGAGTYTVTVTDANGCTVNASVSVSEPPVLTSNANVSSNYNGQAIRCNGGTDGELSVTPGGGTALYTYAWSNGATTQTVTGVGAGTYTVTITDANGCTANSSVTVTEPAQAVSATAQVTSDYNGRNISCNGAADGSVSVTPAGGTAPYTYQWNTGVATQTVTGLSAGTYTVTVTDVNGCATNTSVTLTEPPVLASTASVTSDYNGQPIRCNGNSGAAGGADLTVTPTGGTAVYSYQWSNGATTQNITGVGAGTYTVTITDVNGCVTTSSVAVTEPPVLTSNANVTSNYNGQAIRCNGGTDGELSVTPGGGTAPYTYAWSNGATTQTVTGVGAGTYTVTITDANGCTVNSSITVTEPAQAVSATAQVTSDYNGRNISCNGAADGSVSVTPAGGTAPYTYQWNTGVATQTVTGLSAGTYTVTVTDVNGCTTNTSVTLTEPPVLASTASVTSDYNGQPIRCNGASGATPDGIISATPAGGTAPYTYQWSNGATTQTVNGVDAGTYTVTITDVNGCTVNASVTIGEPPVLTSNSNVTSNYNGQQIRCNGGTDGEISVTPGGGTAPYTYQWSNGATTQAVTGLGAGTYTVTVTDANGCTVNSSVTVTEPAQAVSGTAQVTSDYNGQPIRCNGASGATPDGIISATPAGGTAPYTYQWNNGGTTQTVNGVGAGTYTVTITDVNGCTADASVTIGEPPVLTSNSNVTSNYNGQQIRCNGGTDGEISVTPGGGTAPYTYQWSNGATTQSVTGLGAGTYTVTVTDANGCTVNSSVTVTEPTQAVSGTAQVTSDYNGQPIRCNGASGATPDGIISATPAGGTTPYTYQWSNGATTQTVNGVGAGTYTVIISDVNGCTANASVTIGEPPVLTSNSTVTSNYNGQQIRCNGGTDGAISVTPGGGTAPYTYQWSNGATTQSVTGLGAGTYTVTVTDANGCTVNSSVTVTEPAQPVSGTAQVTSDYNGQPIRCNGASGATPDGEISVTPAGGTAPYTYQWSNGATTQTVNGVGAGTYTVTITDVNGCTANASVTIGEPPVLTSNSTVTSNYNGQQIRCNGGTDGEISVTPGGGTAPYTYQWSNGATTQSVTGVGAGTYTVTVTDANGCTVNSSVTITEPAQPVSGTAQVTSDYHGRNISCNGASDGSVSVTPAGGTAPYTYQWNTGATTQSVTGLAVGNYTVIITDVNGCTANTAVLLNEPPALTSAASVTSNYNGQDVRCNTTAGGAADGVINVIAGGGTVPYTYAWSNGSATQTVSNVGAGGYTVTVTDANGCLANAAVTVNEPPVLGSGASVTGNHNGEDISCHGGNDGAATVTPTGGTAPYTYVWTSGQTTPAISGLTAGSYTVTVTDVNGCRSTASVTVTEPAALQLTATVTDVLCFGNATGAVDLSVAGGVAPYTYAWSNAAVSQDINGLLSGAYTVRVTDANGCIADGNHTVTQPAQTLTGLLSINNVSCFAGSDGTIQVTAAGGTTPYTYVWSNGPTTAVNTAVSAGTYSVTVTDAHACTYAVSGIVQEPAAPIAVTGTGIAVGCFGANTGSINLGVTGGTPGYTYQWSNGAQTRDVTGLSAGTYTVTVTDSKGCTDASFSFTITQPQAALAVSGVLGRVKCFGDANGSVDATVTGGTAPYSYAWSNGATTEDLQNLPHGNYTLVVTDANGCRHDSYTAVLNQPAQPLQIAGAVDHIPCFGGVNGGVNLTVTGGEPGYTFQWSNGASGSGISGLPAGNYSVTVEDGRQCRRDASFVVNQPPQLFLTGTVTDNLCYGKSDGSILLQATGGVPGYRFEWNTGSKDKDIFNLAAGNYVVSVTDANGCNGVAGFTVYAATPMSISLDSLHRIFIGETVELTALVEGGTGSYSYSWFPADGSLSCLDCQTTVAAPLWNTNYVVTVTDGNGCPVSANAFVQVDQDIFIPNTFTPNGNGTNDTFAPVVRMAKECTFTIFNRWGERIFSSRDVNQGWDGNFNGKPVQVDVYVYQVNVVFYNGIEKTFRGNVTVLR